MTETETETVSTETETETETVTETETEAIKVQDETADVTFDTSISFTGFDAIIGEDTKITINNLEGYRYASIYFIQYKGEDEIAKDSIYLYETETGVFTRSYKLTESLSSYTTHVAIEVEVNGDDSKVYTSDKIARTNKADDVSFTISNVAAGISRLNADVEYTGDMKLNSYNSSLGFDTELYYRTSDKEEWKSVSGSDIYVYTSKDNDTKSIYFNGLEEKQTYQGKIVVYKTIYGCEVDDYQYAYYQEIPIKDFTTTEDGIVKFKEAFPDENFRSVVVKAIDDSSITVDTTEVAKSKLEKVTYISSDMSGSYKTTAAITDITGIDLLTSLTDVDLRYHEIGDISNIEWKNLSKLESLRLTGNNLESVPDFSSNTKLKYLYLNENMLSDSKIAGIKTPSNCTVYADNQRLNGFELIVEDNYYLYDGTLHLFVKPTGYKSGFSNSIKFYVDGNTEEFSMTKYSSSYYYNRNAGLSKGSHTIKAVMTINGEELTSNAVSFNVVEQSIFTKQDKYYVPSSDDNNISLYVYTDKLDVSVQKAELVDQNENVYADETSVNSYTTSHDPRYTKISYYAGSDILNSFYVSMDRLKNSIPAGDYNVKITYTDGTSYIINNVVNVTTDAVITSISGGYDYDKTGDYIFLSLQGSGISPENLDYSFTYNKIKYKATYVSYKPTTSGVIVKLKKADNMPRKNNMSVTVNITAQSGSTVYITDGTADIYLSTGIFWLAYNKATNQFETGISAILGREGTVTAELWSSHQSYDNAIKLATASSSLNDDGIAYFTFKNEDDSDWYPTESKSYYVYCTYNGTTDYDSTWVSVSSYSSSVNYWSGYSKYLQGTGDTTFNYYEGAEYNSSDKYESGITGGNLTGALTATVSVSDNSDKTTGTKIVGISQEYNLSKLEVGNYTITLTKNGETLATKSIEIMPKYFILDYFYPSWQDDNTISIYLESPNYVKDDNNYTVTLIDPTGKEVTGLTTTLDYGYANSYLYLKVTGLEKADAYRKYYIKITHKTLGDARTENESGAYVNYFTDDRGEYKTIYTSNGGFTSLYKDGAYRYTGINAKNLTYPITLTVYRPYDATKLFDLTINKANSGDYYYYWSAAEVYNKLPDKDDLYDLVAVDKNGRVITNTEVLIYYRTTTNNNTWSFTTSNSQLKVGDTATITVSGNKGTPKFTSNDTNVVTVTQKGSVATLTAVGAGTTDVAITADGSTKTVSITVTAAVISSINFDNETLTIIAGEDGTLSILGDVANGEINNLAVTSSDESVATATLAEKSGNTYELAKVTVTGKKAGTATITATADGLEEIKATVTVSGVFSDEEQAAKANAVEKFYVDITGKTKTLADVTLPEGWTWVKSATKLTTGKTEYEAKYEANGYEPFTANLTVYSYEISNVTITGSDKLNKTASGTYTVSYDIKGTANIKDSDAKWELSEGSALEVTPSNGEDVTVNAKETGTQTLKVTVGSVSAELPITVYDTNIVTDITVDVKNAESNPIRYINENDKIYVDSTSIGEGAYSFVISAKGYTTGSKESTTPLNWTSSDEGVAEIASNGTVTVKAAGTTKLTVTAEDDGKYSKDIELTVGDFAPKFEGTKVTLYSQTKSASLPIYVNAVNPVKEVKVNGSENITAEVDNNGKNVDIKFNGNIEKKTTEKVTFTFVTELGEYPPTDEIAVTIDTTEPKVTFKQSAKLNVFYKSGEVSFTVTSKNQIDSIELAEETALFSKDDVAFDGSKLTLKTDKLTQNGIGSVNLKINFKDYGTLTKTVTIATEYKTPSLAINAANVIAGQTSFTTNIVDKKTKEVVSDISSVSDLAIKGNTTATLSDATVENGHLTVKYDGSANANYTINVGSNDWNGTVALTGKVTYAKSPKVVFGSKAAIITKDAKTSVVSVSIKDSSAKIASATIKKPKNTDSNLNVYFDADSQSIVAEYNKNAEVNKGTYSYTFTPTVNGTELKATTFKVNVLAANQTATVKFATKGSINLINANEYVTVTPTLNNTTANIKKIEIDIEKIKSDEKNYQNADKFVIESLGNGKYKLAYDDEVVAGLEAKQYKVPVIVSLDDDNDSKVKGEIKVKPVIKLPKVKADVTKGTLYKSSDKTVVANLTTTSKTGSNAIERIVIATDTKKYTDKYFNVEFVANENEPSNGTVTVSLSDIGKSELKAGKYNVTCKVYFESGAASLTEKNAATVKFTITVK